MFSSDLFRFAACIAGLMFAISSLLTMNADARGPGGGGGGHIETPAPGLVHRVQLQ